MRRSSCLLLAVMLVAVSGCKTVPRQQSQTAWYNKQLVMQGASEQQRQVILNGHQAECKYKSIQVAEGAFPSAPPPQQTQFTGRIDGRPVTGTITSGGGVPYYTALDALNAGSRTAEKQRMVQDVFSGCMSEKGWEMVVIPK